MYQCTYARARDRRLGRPIHSMNDSSSTPTTQHHSTTLNARQNFASPDHSIAPLFPQSPHSVPNIVPAIPIPQYKSNPLFSYEQANLSPLSPSGQYRGNDSVPSPSCRYSPPKAMLTPVQSSPDVKSEQSLFENSDVSLNRPDDFPLDLSVKLKSSSSIYSSAEDSLNSFESEVLNLSKKSSSHEMKDTVQENISFAILQQHSDIEASKLSNLFLSNQIQANDFHLTKPRKNGKGRKRLRPSLDLNDPNNNLLKRLSASSKNFSNKEPKIGSPTDQDSASDPNGEGVFTCDQCDKTFSKQSSLARHKYEHSGKGH